MIGITSIRKKLLSDYYRRPYLIKKLLFNLEAFRRNKYRKGNDYRRLSTSLDFASLINIDEEKILEKLNELLLYANKHCNFYHGKLSDKTLESLNEIERLPLLSKKLIRDHRESLASDSCRKRELWQGSTSGSTGSPLSFYKDPESLVFNQILYDKYYQYLGCDISRRRIRLSGIKIVPFDRKKPPYWLYVNAFRQLQGSVYHISERTYEDYLRAFEDYGVHFGTGLPSAWTALARLMNFKRKRWVGLKAIITDSEGLAEEDRKEIEKAFACPVYRTYGLGEVGMFAVECKNKNYHIVPYTHIAEIVDEEGKHIPDGRTGEIVVTDLHSGKYPFIRYRTGDLGIMYKEGCGCEINTPFFSEIVGRVEDYIVTSDGRRFGRVSLILRRAKNIQESQIVQLSSRELLIRVVPDENFDASDMALVVKDAHEFVGDMEVSWEAVDKLERMPSGKLKFLVREKGVLNSND